jgi:hypothetical protein
MANRSDINFFPTEPDMQNTLYPNIDTTIKSSGITSGPIDNTDFMELHASRDTTDNSIIGPQIRFHILDLTQKKLDDVKKTCCTLQYNLQCINNRIDSLDSRVNSLENYLVSFRRKMQDLLFAGAGIFAVGCLALLYAGI